jgi:hypothetical protein
VSHCEATLATPKKGLHGKFGGSANLQTLSKYTSVTPKKKSPRSPDRGFLFAFTLGNFLQICRRLNICSTLALGQLPSEHIGTVHAESVTVYLAVVVQGREWQSTMAAMEW